MTQETTAKKHIIKINLPGGIVAAGDLLDILNSAEKAGISTVSLGNRQQLFLAVTEDGLEDLEHEFLIADIDYEKDADTYPNIISSYVSEDIFSVSNWLREGVYKDILDGFEFKPQLKINLADNNQTFIPFFTGNLNYIASGISNFWHLHIRFPKTNNFYSWPSLVYTEDIAALSRLIEENIYANKNLFYDKEEIDGSILYEKISILKRFITQSPNEPLTLPDFQLPYYEGLNKYGNNKYWLGIYKRNEEYSVSFLKDVCALCLQTRVGQIYTTPWKSLIIKDIHPEDRKLWNTALAKNRINVRHASNELNWQLEDNCHYGLKLKQHLVRQFDIIDLRTFKLSFAIKINPKTGLFGSVIIKKLVTQEGEEDAFDILHTRDFNPNSKDFITYRENVKYSDLADVLTGLCDYFYTIQTDGSLLVAPSIAEEAKQEEIEVILHQCKNCGTVYDSAYGDDFNNIAPGTAFNLLPETYCCPTCDSSKSDFVEVDKNSLAFFA